MSVFTLDSQLPELPLPKRTWPERTKVSRLGLPDWMTPGKKKQRTNAAEDGFLFTDKSFVWDPPGPEGQGGPDDEGRSLIDRLDGYLRTTQLHRQLEHILETERKSLARWQRSLEILAVAALLVFFL